MIKKQLGQRIATLRRAAGLTQEGFAEKANYSVEFVSFVERGINAPSVEGCARIAAALGIQLRDIFDFTGELTPIPPAREMTERVIPTQRH